MSKKDPKSVAAAKQWEKILAEEKRLRDIRSYEANKRTTEFIMSPLWAGMAGVGGWAASRGILGLDDRKDLGEELNRSRFVDGNKSKFKGVDPRLIKAWTKKGYMGVLNAADDVFSETIGVGTEHVPADISQAGKFQPTRKTIGTVTPEPNSARFASRVANPDALGGSQSATLWGNDTIPQYTYAYGNTSVQRVDAKNPTVHFSEVDLPEGDQVPYQTTGTANELGESGRGWGRDRSGDMHFGKEYIKNRARVTANDIYTYLKREGASAPIPGKDPATNLSRLTGALKKHTGLSSEYKALQSIASPVPTFGDSPRMAGSLPILDYYDVTSPNASKAGFGSFFLDNKNNTELLKSQDFDISENFGRYAQPGEVKNNAKHGLRWNPDLDAGIVPDGAEGLGGLGVSKWVQNVRAGLFTAALTSPEAAKAYRAGDLTRGHLTIAGSYVGGEAVGAALNKTAQHLSRKGVNWASSALPTIAKAGTPLVIRDVMDTGVTLATGKTINEHIVDSDNVGPGIAVSTAPQSITPVGSFSGHRHTQATVKDTRTEKMKAEVAAFDKKRNDAIKRGGKWKIGGLTVPELGISESVMGLFGR